MPSVLSTLFRWLNPNRRHRKAVTKQIKKEWAERLANCRKHDGFFFFDLPTNVRQAIYYYIFLNSEIEVCDFNKNHKSNTFATDERCQILLTCRRCCDEATPTMYRLTNFRFTKPDAFNYLNWCIRDKSKLSLINKITLTQAQIFPLFVDSAKHYPNLQQVVIDVPLKIQHTVRFGYREHHAIALAVRNNEWVNNHICTFLTSATSRSRPYQLKLVVQFQFIIGNSAPEYEIVLVNLDLLTITRNYRPYLLPPLDVSVFSSSSSSDEENETEPFPPYHE